MKMTPSAIAAMLATDIRKLTVRDYHLMAEAGIFAPDERVELLDGTLYTMAPQGPIHADLTYYLQRQFLSALGDRIDARPHSLIALSDISEPEPDLAIVRRQRYGVRHPHPDEIFLLVEVADSSLRRDRDLKPLVYARAGIPEYWLVDVQTREILVHREPSAEGYRRIDPVGTTLAPVAFPDCALDLSQLWG